MKRFNLILKLGVMVGFLFGPCYGFAEDINDVFDSTFTLEDGLKKLQQSTNKLKKKNAWLEQQIKEAEQDIAAEQKKMDLMEEQKQNKEIIKQEILHTEKTQSKAMELLQTKVERLRKEKESKNKQLATLKSQMNKIKIEGQKTEKKIFVMNKDIKRLEKRINGQTYLKKLDRFKSEQDKKRKSIEKYRRKLKEATKDHDKVSRKYAKPEAKKEGLENRRNDLEERSKQLKRTYDTTMEDFELLQNELFSVKDKKQAFEEQMTQEIKALKAKEKELSEVLDKAGVKLTERNIDLTQLKKAHKHLKLNLETLQNENEILEQEYELLERQARLLEGK